MKRVEIESLLKGFILFFISMGTLFSIVIYTTYTKEIKNLEDTMLDKMRIYNFNLKGDEFGIDFSNSSNRTTYKLYKEDGLKAFFPIPNSKRNLLVISLSEEKYQIAISEIRWNLIKEFTPIILIIAILSIIFSFYTLQPMYDSLKLTEEFIKDILHDFNTPLATLRLNNSMLKREIGENKKINRMESSIENILALQENLRCYLFDHEMQQLAINLKQIVKESINTIEKTYPHINYVLEIEDKIELETNKKAFKRIIDNIITNASKYNKQNGKVTISYKNNQLTISDTGKGIKDTKKIFQRFYKEQDRGIGVGLHIVKKLCDELKIEIKVESKIDIGSRFILIFMD